MVVGIESWKDVRTSLMKDVHGFIPHSMSCQNLPIHRTNSLNSLQSFCSTNFSSDEDNNFSGLLDGVPLPPSEDEEEDWRMFGWLLDSADANSSMPYSNDYYKPPKTYSPLPPLEIPSDASLPEASDLLKIKRKLRFYNSAFEYRDPQSRKRCSFSSDGDDESEEEEDMFEYRPMTRAMAHYLECKRRRKIGAPMPEEDTYPTPEPKIEVEETYRYEPIKEEYSMESAEIIDDSIASEPYIDMSDIKPDIISDPVLSKKGKKVEVIRGIKSSDGKRTKPGRPTNKEKRQIERETKKILRKQKKEAPQDLKQAFGSKICYCQKVFDPTQDHIKCSHCKQLFHPKCAKITLSKVEKLPEWYCKTCEPNPQTMEGTEENEESDVHCVCREPYDPSAHWIGCNICDKWFHPECVHTTIEAVQAAGEFICHECAFQRALQREEEPIIPQDDGVYYV